MMTAAEEALARYEAEERVLTPAFVEAIPWHEARAHPLAPQFLKTLYYMRDVEKFTALYYEQLMCTPTGRDPVISRFMTRWEKEEALHGDLLNRFLVAYGNYVLPNWDEKIFARIPRRYLWLSKITELVARRVGESFAAVHMTWGAINEYSTLGGYARLADLAKHPVLAHLLRGIIEEEARHAIFYWRIARVKIHESRRAERLARFAIDHFWTPVGQGAKRKSDTEEVIRALFSGEEGIAFFDRKVTGHLQQLPGFWSCTKPTDVVRSVVDEVNDKSLSA